MELDEGVRAESERGGEVGDEIAQAEVDAGDGEGLCGVGMAEGSVLNVDFADVEVKVGRGGWRCGFAGWVGVGFRGKCAGVDDRIQKFQLVKAGLAPEEIAEGKIQAETGKVGVEGVVVFPEGETGDFEAGEGVEADGFRGKVGLQRLARPGQHHGSQEHIPGQENPQQEQQDRQDEEAGQNFFSAGRFGGHGVF